MTIADAKVVGKKISPYVVKIKGERKVSSQTLIQVNGSGVLYFDGKRTCILTAAHVINELKDLFKDTAEACVRLTIPIYGKDDIYLDTLCENNGTLESKDVFLCVHDKYKHGTYDNDIGYIEIASCHGLCEKSPYKMMSHMELEHTDQALFITGFPGNDAGIAAAKPLIDPRRVYIEDEKVYVFQYTPVSDVMERNELLAGYSGSGIFADYHDEIVLTGIVSRGVGPEKEERYQEHAVPMSVIIPFLEENQIEVSRVCSENHIYKKDCTKKKTKKSLKDSRSLLKLLSGCSFFLIVIVAALGLWYHSEKSKHTPEQSIQEQLLLAEEYFMSQEYTKAANIYASIAADSPVAGNNLAYIYESGYITGHSEEDICNLYQKAAEAGDEKALRNYIHAAISVKSNENLLNAVKIAYKMKSQNCMEFLYCAGQERKLTLEIREKIRGGYLNQWFEEINLNDVEQILARLDSWRSVDTKYQPTSGLAYIEKESKWVFEGAVAGRGKNGAGIFYKYAVYQRGWTYLNFLAQISDLGYTFVADSITVKAQDTEEPSSETEEIQQEEQFVLESMERINLDGGHGIALGYQSAGNDSLQISGWVCRGESNIWKSELELARDGEETEDDLVKYRFHVRNTSDELIENLTLRCTLCKYMDFIPGSVKLANANHPEGIGISDVLFSDLGCNIGDYAADAGAWIYFSAKVKETELEKKSLALETLFEGNGGAGTVELPLYVLVPFSPHYIKVRTTKKQSDIWYESIEVKEHELVSVRVDFDNNSGMLAENVTVNVDIPYGFEYVKGSTEMISSATGGKALPLPDGIADSDGISIGKIGDANGIVIFQIRSISDADSCEELPVKMKWEKEIVQDWVLLYSAVQSEMVGKPEKS